MAVKLAALACEVHFSVMFLTAQAAFPAWLFIGDFSSRTSYFRFKCNVTNAFFQSSLVIYVCGQCCLVIMELKSTGQI